METLEELQAILDGAPDGATHYSVSQYDFVEVYFKLNNCICLCDYGNEGWKDINEPVSIDGNYYVRDISDIQRIVDLMIAERNLREKIVDIGRVYRNVLEQRDDLRVQKFKRFNNEQCWLYQGDGEDYLESLVCPVVISPSKLIDIINGVDNG